MKNLQEVLQEVQSFSEYLAEKENVQVDEGLKDVLNNLKNKFKKIVQFFKGLVAKFSTYWLPVSEDGEVLPAITPLTAGQAYADGLINFSSTVVAVGKTASRLTGCKATPKDALKLYGSGNSIAYWRRMLNESQANNPNVLKEMEEKHQKMLFENLQNVEQITDINEVKMQNTDFEAKYNVVDTPGLKRVISARLKNPKLTRLLVWGAPGIGKTAIIRACLDELPNKDEWNLVVKTLSNETADNFTLPKYVEVDGQDKATDVPKTWLPVYKPTGDDERDRQLDEACGKGLLFVDELSRATQQVLNVMLPILNEGEFNGYKIGSGWVIMAASNRMEDDLSSQSDIGNALANRFSAYYYEPTCKSWTKWAETQNYISPLLLQWLNLPASENMSGGKFFYFDPNDEGQNNDVSKIMCSPRSWTNAMQELACYSETGKLEGWTIFDLYRECPDILKSTLNSYVPASAVDSFVAFLDVIGTVGDFETFADEVWHNNGKGAKLNNRDLMACAIPICQLLITANDPATHWPTAEEFSSFASWLVAQDNDSLARYAFDILENVYASVLPENVRSMVFVGAEFYRTNQGKPTCAIIENRCKPLIDKLNSKYGMNVQNLGEIPDWSEGFGKLSKAYKSIFAATKINGIG